MADLTPSDIIGSAALKRLQAAGFEVVTREMVHVVQFECPHCDAIHSSKLGHQADVYWNWGELWHADCVSFYETWPSKRGDRMPMRETRGPADQTKGGL